MSVLAVLTHDEEELSENNHGEKLKLTQSDHVRSVPAR